MGNFLIHDEFERTEVLASYHIIDTPREGAFDCIVYTAAQWFAVPIAMVSFYDGHRQWLKAQVGLVPGEIAAAAAFCARTEASHDVMVVEDAATDDRLRRNPLVAGTAHFRFYAAAPLISSEGAALGSLCLIDRVPRHFNDEQKATLAELAEDVMQLLGTRRAVMA